jgi:hypothetical protein
MIKKILPIIVAVVLIAGVFGCVQQTADTKENEVVDRQQDHYGKNQPVHFYDYSIPRDVLIQIYDVLTTEARNTYTVTETITGVTKWRCPSIGFPIPVDTQLTNPLKAIKRTKGSEYSAVIEQAEPNGLFTSKNTDATWCVCVDELTGIVYPHYTEHKAQAWPFMVTKNQDGEWVRADRKPIQVTIDIEKAKAEVKKAIEMSKSLKQQ